MTNQAALGRGGGVAGRNRGKGGRFAGRFNSGGRGYQKSCACVSSISEIANDTFNMGSSTFAAQFSESRENVANCVQRSSMKEGFLVAQTIRTGVE